MKGVETRVYGTLYRACVYILCASGWPMTQLIRRFVVSDAWGCATLSKVGKRSNLKYFI